MNNHFDIEDFRPYADKHRGKYVLSGPHWPLILRYPVLFDEYEKLVNINAQEQYRLNTEIARLTAELAAANEDAGYLADAAEMLMQKWGSDDVVMFDFARISAVIEHYRARVGQS